MRWFLLVLAAMGCAADAPRVAAVDATPVPEPPVVEQARSVDLRLPRVVELAPHRTEFEKRLMRQRIEAAAALGEPAALFVPSLEYSDAELAEAVAGTARLRGLPIHLRVPFDWEQDPFDNRVYRLGLQAWWGIAPLLVGHASNRAPGGLQLAIDLAVDWLATYRIEQPGQSEFAWNGSAATFRAVYMAYMFRAAAFEGTLDEVRAARLWEGMIRHGEFLVEGTQFRTNNLGATHDAGLGLLGHQMPILEDAARYIETATTRLAPLFDTLLTEDHLLAEHTPWYHFLVLRDLLNTSRFAPSIAPTFEAAADAGRWLIAPDGLFVQFGDAHLFAPGPDVVDGTTTPRGLAVFSDTGYGVAREGDSFLAVTGQFHSRTHKQADELTFSWSERGRRIVADTGRYGYFSEPGRAFAVSTRAHSSLVVDGEEFSRDVADVYGSGIDGGAFADGWYALTGENPPLLARQGVRHRRWWLFSPDRTLVIVDDVHMAAPRRLTRYVHLGPSLRARAGSTPEAVVALDGDLAVSVADASSTPVAPRIVRGRRRPELQGFTFPNARELVERDTIVFEQTSGAALLITALRLERVPHTRLNATKDGDVLTVEIDAQQIELTLLEGTVGITVR